MIWGEFCKTYGEEGDGSAWLAMFLQSKKNEVHGSRIYGRILVGISLISKLGELTIDTADEGIWMVWCKNYCYGHFFYVLKYTLSSSSHNSDCELSFLF